MDFTLLQLEKENLNVLHQHKLDFFTNITHEFKTPLSIIIASVDMLTKNQSISKDEANEMNFSIKRSASRLLTLVNQLMDFRKIETEHAELYISNQNIIDFTNEILSNHRPLLQMKNISLEERMSYFNTEVYFDFDKLEKIITNLLTNAIKYSPPNSNVEFHLDAKEDELKLRIKDFGRGMNIEQKKRVFEVFYAKSEENELMEGSGVGLALTASLVKFLKGTIEVESREGYGSEFIVNLPMIYSPINELSTNKTEMDLDVSIEDTPDSSDSISSKEFNLVIVEDNKDLLKLMENHFSKTYNVKLVVMH